MRGADASEMRFRSPPEHLLAQSSFNSEGLHKKGRASLPAPLACASGLGVENCHDLERPGIDYHDLVTNQNELISAPIRINGHDFRRQRVERHVARNAGCRPKLRN